MGAEGLEGLAVGDASLVTVTFLFTDIEGSTALWENEPEAMRVALRRHNALLAAAIAGHGGYVFKTVGDAFCVTFDHAADALATACQIQTSLSAEVWPTQTPMRVRVALHTGPAHMSDGDYYGTTVNRCARLLAVTRGGQTLLSSTTEALARDALPPSASLRDVGMLRLRDLPHPVHAFQLVHAGLLPNLLEMSDPSAESNLTARPIARFKPIDLYDIPTLPAIIVQAINVMQDPDSDAKDVQKVIERDPAISAKILRVANSAFFGYSRRITTIVDAVRVLGYTNVQGMIIGVGAFDAFRTQRLNLAEFWKHSIVTATAARFLAPRTGCAADEAFMAGILHDIGKLVFAIQSEVAYERVLELERDAAMSSIEAERTLFEFTHPEVGAAMVERWELPVKYVDAIAHHHDIGALSDANIFCGLIGLADHLAHVALADRRESAACAEERGVLIDALHLAATDSDECLQHLHDVQTGIDEFVRAIR